MVSASGGAQFSSVADNLFSATTPSVSSSSFSQQLEAALEQFLKQSSNGGQLEINIQPSQSQVSGASQFLVTVTGQPTEPSAPVTPPTPVAVPVPAPATALTASPSAPQEDFVTVPFGNSYSTVPTLATELANQDAMMESPMMTQAAILNQDLVSQAGDPMAGQPVSGTNLMWNDLTQDQRVAYMYAWHGVNHHTTFLR
jgi:hypothetical protein